MNCTAPLVLGINESYSLRVIAGSSSGTTIAIAAPTQAGVLYALETLSQLIHFEPALHGGDGGYLMPCVSVDDTPRFPHRELMLDSARFFLPVALLKQSIDAMVQTKLNVLHLHLTDAESFPLVLKSRPEFAQIAFSPRERYTLRELKALAAFAAERNIRLVVEIDVPSHVGDKGSPGWCLPFPEVCPTPRCAHNSLNPGLNLSYEIIEDIVRELAEALPDAYLHFGGDEVLQDALPPHDCWQAAPEISAWMNRTFSPPGRDPRGFGGAVAYFNDRVEAMAKTHKRKSIRWEEAFYYSCCDAPTYTDPCPGGFVEGCKTDRDTIVHHWRAGTAWSGELVKLTSGHGYSMITSAGWCKSNISTSSSTTTTTTTTTRSSNN
jgi:hexosaminidase